ILTLSAIQRIPKSKILELPEITDAYGRIKIGLVGAGGGQEEELKPWSKNVIRARRHDEHLTLFSKGSAKEVKDDESRKFDFLIVTDNDEDATAPKSQWRAITRKGVLKLSKDNSTAHVEWDSKSSDQELMSGFSYKGRGMELSDLTEYRGRILAPDDKTGIIFEIKKNQV
ncbi:hypothetical protein NECAME_16259, partial [Necator americanus]